MFGDPTYADAILDRIVHNAHRINLTGHSLRRLRTNKAPRNDLSSGTKTPVADRKWGYRHSGPVAGLLPYGATPVMQMSSRLSSLVSPGENSLGVRKFRRTIVVGLVRPLPD
jgi:hypothetical protein